MNQSITRERALKSQQGSVVEGRELRAEIESWSLRELSHPGDPHEHFLVNFLPTDLSQSLLSEVLNL